MSGAGFNGNEALRSRVLMDVKPSASHFERLFCDCIVNTFATETDTRRCPERASMALKPSAAVN